MMDVVAAVMVPGRKKTSVDVAVSAGGCGSYSGGVLDVGGDTRRSSVPILVDY